jgi:hypothetical protein
MDTDFQGKKIKDAVSQLSDEPDKDIFQRIFPFEQNGRNVLNSMETTEKR